MAGTYTERPTNDMFNEDSAGIEAPAEDPIYEAEQRADVVNDQINAVLGSPLQRKDPYKADGYRPSESPRRRDP